MSHAPHRTHVVFINDGAFVPKDVDKKVLRAEEFKVSEGSNKIMLTLSDYYADEYTVNMGPATDSMLAFVRHLTTEKRYCMIKSYMVKKEGGNFHKPVVKAVEKRFNYA